jgi:outer membrane receptor protein involved in Fe transport
MGSITGGLSNFFVQDGWAPLDHDQRNTLSIGFEMRLPWTSSLNGNVNYGSGFTNGAAVGFPGLIPPAPEYLSGHTTLDLSLSKSFRERFSVAVNALNVTNSHLLIDDSLTFGGFHFNDPREVYVELRYRFHY